MTDLQPLRAFVAVARAGNVSRAAEALHLSQPAVSLQLKALSDQTKLTLFNRKARGLELTRDGAALLPQAERALAGLADFYRAASGLQDTVHGVLRIGTILDPEFTRLGSFLKQLVEMAPHIDTELRQAMSGTVLDQIKQEELDVGFYLVGGGQPGKRAVADAIDFRQFAVRRLTRFTYLVVAPAGWESRVQGKDWHALAKLPWLETPVQSAHHRLMSSVFGMGSLTNLMPARVALVDQEASMLDLVKSGVGLSLMRDSIAIRESQAHGLAVADKVSLHCALSFICLQKRREELVIDAAWNALDRAWSA
ncbi:MAG: LysR family transcriptional regulator [Variovorax sp.]|nr:MAG: LysR family transcriptional regulator [Variovorax sp.]